MTLARRGPMRRVRGLNDQPNTRAATPGIKGAAGAA